MISNQLRNLKPESQQRVLFLHHAAFAHSACETCAGSCCRNCAGNFGYLEDGDFDEAKKKYGFDEKKGFQRETGCALPLMERSGICLGFICYDPPHVSIAPNSKKEDRFGIWHRGAKACADEIHHEFYNNKDGM